MSIQKRSAVLGYWWLVLAGVMTLGACAHRAEPGEEIINCGPQNQLRAKQTRLPSTSSGVAVIDIVTSDRFENIPNVQIGFSSPKGQFYVDRLSRSYGYTNSRGQLRVEWHSPDAGGEAAGEPVVVSFQALDFPGDCVVDLEVTPKR